MFCKTYKCVALICGILALVAFFDGLSASADGKKDGKEKSAPSGTWLRKEGELKIEFDGKGAMKVCPHGDSKKIAILFDCTVEAAGRIKVKAAGFEGEEKVIDKVKEHIPKGLTFSFKWTVKEDTAKLDDLKGEGDSIAHLKERLEGDYDKK